MAATVVEIVMSPNIAPSSQIVDYLQADNHSQVTNVEKPIIWTHSKCIPSPNVSMLEDVSSSYAFGYSFNQHSRQKTAGDIESSDKDNDKIKSQLDHKSSATMARPGKNFDSPYFQQRSTTDILSQSSFEALIGNSFDSTKRSQTSMPENISENKWNFSSDYPNFSFDKPTTFETNKPKYNQLSAVDSTSSSNYHSTSQIFDFERMKKTYNFDSTNNTLKSENKQIDTANINIQSKKYSGFDDSEFEIKLRGSMHSNFLSNEFRNNKPSVHEELKSESSKTLRTIEEILQQYGISDNIPTKSTQSAEERGNKSVGSSQIGLANVPLNNEISQSFSRTAASGPDGLPLSSQDKGGVNIFPSSATKNLNTIFRTDLISSSSNLDSIISTTLNTGFPMNVSQNNEATPTSQSNSENEPLKKSGSSVDYSSYGKMGAYSGSTSYRNFDYGKPTSYSGENSRATVNAFSSLETKQFEGNIDKIKYEGSQVDIGQSGFNISKSTPLDIIKNMGSVTDSLEYSMSTERQRLRKLDTLISATPLNYSSLELSRSLRPQYLSPERSFGTLRSSDLSGRGMYSTSNLPSSSGHGAGMSHKNMAGGSGRRDMTTALNKSISAPGNAERNLQRPGQYDSSVDPTAPYWSYGSKDYNFQYNNVYNPQLLDKLASQKNDKKPQKKPLPTKKKECSLKNKKEEPFYSNNNQSLYSQSATGINFLNSRLRGDKNITAERKRYAVKPEAKKTTGAKKNCGMNFNQSKNVMNTIDGFDFVKDLNRMWKETVFGSALSGKSNQTQKQSKYAPYKPTASSHATQETSSDGHGTRDLGSRDNSQPLARKSNSNWTLAGSVGKYTGYDSDFGFKSAHKIRSQSSLEPRRGLQPKTKASSCSLVKQKSSNTFGMPKRQATPAPKSILKQPNSKAMGGASSEMNRPHSAMLTSSRSYTQSPYQMPYQLIRGFSPLELNKTGRTNISTTAKKSDSSTKNKTVPRKSKPGLKK